MVDFVLQCLGQDVAATLGMALVAVAGMLVGFLAGLDAGERRAGAAFGRRWNREMARQMRQRDR